MDDLRVAVIGYGLSGSVFHAPLIESTDGLVVASVVTGDADRQDQVRREHPRAEVLPGADELWDRAAAHDLVVVATANHAHVSLATRALQAGLPVVVDKPLALTAAEARGLVELAERLGLLLVPFHNRRWDSDHLTVTKLRSDDTLGDVLRYESRFERWRPQLKSPRVWRESTSPAQGGGVLLDLGAHLVDQALVLFGDVSHVYGEVDIRRGGVADDDAFLALQHVDGTASHLWVSAVAAAPGPRLRVLGTRGAYVVEGLDGQEEALRAGRRPADPQSWGREPASRAGRVVRGESSQEVQTQPGAWPCFYRAVADSLRHGHPPPVDARDAVRGLEVLDAARRSAARRELVGVTAVGG